MTRCTPHARCCVARDPNPPPPARTGLDALWNSGVWRDLLGNDGESLLQSPLLTTPPLTSVPEHQVDDDAQQVNSCVAAWGAVMRARICMRVCV